MGAAESVEHLPVRGPLRPFKPTRKVCIVDKVLLPKSSPIPILHQLILAQDWQRVLIRLNLFPVELRMTHTIELYKISLELLPLHLACALNPPETVIQLMLKHHVDAAVTPIRTKQSKGIRFKKHWKRFQDWKRSRKGAFPIALEEDRQFLLLGSMEEASAFYSVLSASRKAIEEESVKSITSSISSQHSLEHENDVILQLSPSGSLKTLPINTSNETESTSESSNIRSIFRIHWDMYPLWSIVASSGELLPLHLACLYRVSPGVLASLVRAYPLAALQDVLGMLPIHWVAAGWMLSRILPSPPSIIPRESTAGPYESLQVLKDAVPETIQVQSGNHGLSPADYIDECMEEGEYKEACLRLLRHANDVDNYSVAISEVSHVFVDSDDASTVNMCLPNYVACLGTLISDKNWSQTLEALEEDPSLASKWIYGLDEPRNAGAIPFVWKRLPIHLICAKANAPIGLTKLVLELYPEGALMTETYSGSSPLHIACETGASLATVHALLDRAPDSTFIADLQGRLPLHVAILTAAPYALVEALASHDPESVTVVDQFGKTALDYAMDIYGSDHVIVDFLSMILMFLDAI